MLSHSSLLKSDKSQKLMIFTQLLIKKISSHANALSRRFQTAVRLILYHFHIFDRTGEFGKFVDSRVLDLVHTRKEELILIGG